MTLDQHSSKRESGDDRRARHCRGGARHHRRERARGPAHPRYRGAGRHQYRHAALPRALQGGADQRSWPRRIRDDFRAQALRRPRDGKSALEQLQHGVRRFPRNRARAARTDQHPDRTWRAGPPRSRHRRHRHAAPPVLAQPVRRHLPPRHRRRLVSPRSRPRGRRPDHHWRPVRLLAPVRHIARHRLEPLLAELERAFIRKS